MTMLIVTMAALVVGGLIGRGQVLVRSVEARSSLAQLRWVEVAVLDWVSALLLYDRALSETPNDNLMGLWATPLAKMQLNETVLGGRPIGSGPSHLSGDIADAAGRLNLNNLVGKGKLSQQYLEGFERLLGRLGLSPDLAGVVQNQLFQAYPAKGPPAALPLIQVSDLLALPGFDEEIIEVLSPFVVFLPKRITRGSLPLETANTKINVNTVSPEVLSAMIPKLGLLDARDFLARYRDRTFFQSVSDFKKRLGGEMEVSADLFSVSSDFFVVDGAVTIDGVTVDSQALLYRWGRGVEVVWHNRP